MTTLMLWVCCGLLLYLYLQVLEHLRLGRITPAVWRLSTWVRLMMLTAASFAASPADACLVQQAVPIEQLARNADVVFKATVIADRPVTDAWFEPIPGLEVRETQLRVVYVVKGVARAVIKFRHYAPTDVPHSSSTPIAPALTRATLCRPANYTLALFHNYLISAAHVAGDTYRQLGKGTISHDRSVLLAADAKVNPSKTLSEAAWNELQALLKSSNEDEVVEAIGQLDGMSGAFGQTAPIDFERSKVLGAIQPLLESKNSAIAGAAGAVYSGGTEH